MPTIVFLATAWGPRAGGINTFNMDIARALAKVVGPRGRVVCVVPRGAATDDDAPEHRVTKDGEVTIVHLGLEAGEAFDPGWVGSTWTRLQEAGLDSVDWWLGHDVVSGEAANRARSETKQGRSAVIMHMSYRDYQGFKHGSAQEAKRKHEKQRKVFEHADRVLAVGPLLRKRASELADDVRMLIPGLPEIPRVRPPVDRAAAISFGRLDPANDRIKQVSLAVGGFAEACRKARETTGRTPLLRGNDASLTLLGVSSAEEEQKLVRLAEERGGRRITVHALPYEEDRGKLLRQVAESNLALMLSWHEGFGLTGWEAIAAEVPLITTTESGLYQFLRDEGLGTMVHPVSIDGAGSGPEEEDGEVPFTYADQTRVAERILEICVQLEVHRKTAQTLKKSLVDKDCSWPKGARELLEALGLPPDGGAGLSEASGGSRSRPSPMWTPEVNPGTPAPADRDDGTHRNVENGEYDFFLAHAEADTPQARALFDLLEAKHRVFLDVASLSPGDLWDIMKPAAQRRSKVTVVLVGSSSESAYYHREEIAAALDLARQPDGQHRVVPVYLSGTQPPGELHFGLRRLVGLFLERHGNMPGVALELERTLARVGGSATGISMSPSPDLIARIEDAQQRLALLQRSGAPSGDIKVAQEDLLALKRRKREGAQMQTGDVLVHRYCLEERVGVGGFGTVWRAYDRTRRCAVAVKVLHMQWADSEERRDRFFRGARVMASLEHPGIVRIVQEQGVHHGNHFFVMEYLADGDLRQLVLDGRIVSDDMAAIVADIADALSYAHSRGMVHRDVKPANILFDHAGRAKLTDFDLVRAADTTGGTRTGVLGTFGYVAPEALDQAREAGPTADIYSLGMTAVFILHGADLPGVAHRAPERFIGRLSCEEPLKQILLHAVEPEPEHRFASMQEFAALVRWWRYGLLPREGLDTLLVAATETHLVGERQALLSGINQTIVASLPRHEVPLEQLRSDLDRLNRTPTWTDETSPLLVWLRNAISLTQPRGKSEIFDRARISLDKAVLDRMNGLGPMVAGSARSTEGVASLTPSELEELVRATVTANIFGPDYRSALMNGLPEHVVSQMRVVDAPLDQLRLDLEVLNTWPQLAERGAPLHTWLTNAHWLCGARAPSEVFARAAARIAEDNLVIAEGAADILLDRASIQALVEMMLSHRMADRDRRETLLGELSPRLRYSLPDAASPLLQMESDLRILSQMSNITEPDRSPLVMWLHNAAALAAIGHNDAPLAEKLKRIAEEVMARVSERKRSLPNV